MMEYREGGLKDQGGSVDPVSGNEVPPGALKEEVRDDIDARLSEGEFVFPADVVRYIGLEKLMMMRQQAKVGLSRMEDMGQMSNADEAIMEDDVPADVFDMPDDMDVPAVMIAELEMAEGGDVKGEKRYKSFRELMGTDGDKAEIVTYVNDAGRKIIIMHINGAPVSQVPEGFYPEGSDPTDDPAVPDPAPTAPQQPGVQQPQVQQEDDDPDPDTPSATIVTGGFISNGRIVGGTTWGISYEFDGRVNLKNSEYGEIQLTAEEAKSLDLGSKGIGGFFSALTPDGVKKSKERTASLNSGSAADPGSGNAIHKALVERAGLQQKGKEFVEGGSPEMGLKDSIKSIFGDGPRNELQDALAQALGKTSNMFTEADYAIIGLALQGGVQTHTTGLGNVDTTKIDAVQTLLNQIEGSGVQRFMQDDDPGDAGGGAGVTGSGLDMTPPTAQAPDGPDGPGFNTPIFGTQPPPTGPGGDQPLPTVPQPNVDPRPTNQYDPDPDDDTTPTVPPSYANLSGMSLSRAPGADMGNLYEFDDRRPVSDPRPTNQYSFSSSPSMSTPTNFERTSTPFNAGGLGTKKRKGLASRK